MANDDYLSSLWKEWLEETPRALYGAMLPTGTPSFTDYWKSQYGNVYGDYMKRLGEMALGGQVPSLDYSSYLSQYPWMRYWQNLAPSQRGEYPSRFAPGLRWVL